MFEGFWSGVKNFFIGTDQQYVNERIPQLISGKRFDLSKADKISTVYTCVDILSKTLAKLPLEKYIESENGKEKDKLSPLYNIIHRNPNAYTSSFTFFQALEANRNLKGNSFAQIERNANGEVLGLYLLNSKQVQAYKIVNNQLYYFVQLDPEKDKLTPVPATNILHFRMMTRDGIWGMNPIEALRNNLSTTYKGMTTIDTFYDNNAASPKAIKSTVSGGNQTVMIQAVKLFNDEFSGGTNAGKMIPLPPNTEIQELKLNFADAQFIETVKFNANQIAALFGVPSHMVGNTEVSKFNNVEQMAIGMKADTMSPIARMYRQELELKLLTTKQLNNCESIEFNLAAMIETDHKTRIEGYKILNSFGAMSANDVCRIENLPTDPDGDIRNVPMNMMALSKLGFDSAQPPKGKGKAAPVDTVDPNEKNNPDNTDNNGD